MALAEGVKTVKLTVNGVELDVPQGELIVESVKRLGLEIPVFCYHPRMDPVGMCRMCLVEVGFKQPDGSVRMMPKPQAGCTLPASDGMVVYTDSENVHRDRKGVLEFLLANHPLDCPICDRGGECPLQNNTLAYGPSTSRFIELKRHLPKAFPLSKYVTLDLERCIQCGRCVRFTEEISGEAELAFRFRGANMQPSTFQLTDFESKFSGNVIEICPVGALTSAKYRFRARPWDLETSPAVCTQCSVGCSVWFDYRAGRYVRTNGRVNEQVNEEWTCDKGKFGHDYYNSPDRLTKPLLRKGDKFVECTWSEAYDAIAKGFENVPAAGLVGGRVSNEGLYLFKKLLRDVFNSGDIDYRWNKALVDPTVTSTIAGLESATSVLVFCSRLADELPIVYLRLRKAATKMGVKVVLVTSENDEAVEFATSVIKINRGQELDAANAIASNGQLAGASAEAVSLANDCLKAGGVVITSDGLFDASDGDRTATVLKQAAERLGGSFNCWSTATNGTGASLIGLGRGSGTWQILDNAVSGATKALWLVECDPTRFERGATALETVDFVVYQGTLMNEAAPYASVVLPMAAPAEQDGTWTNCEGRIQRIKQAIRAPGEAKPAWRIFAETLLRMQPATPYFNANEVFSAIASEVEGLAGVNVENLPEDGLVVSLNAVQSVAGESG